MPPQRADLPGDTPASARNSETASGRTCRSHSFKVIELPISVVFDQAEHRLHAQKALLIEMLK